MRTVRNSSRMLGGVPARGGVFGPKGGGYQPVGYLVPGGTWPGTPPREQNDWQTGVKT